MQATDRTGRRPPPADVVTGTPPAIAGLLRRAATIRGVVEASLIDHTTGRTLGRLTGADGAAPPAHAVALVDAVLHAAVHAPAVGTDRLEDVVVTTADWYHLVRPVRTGAGPWVVLHLRLDRGGSNLALARRSLAALGTDGG